MLLPTVFYPALSIWGLLQVLLSLPSFVGDLRRGQQQLEAAGQPLSGSGVYAALLECAAARDARVDRWVLQGCGVLIHGSSAGDLLEAFPASTAS